MPLPIVAIIFIVVLQNFKILLVMYAQCRLEVNSSYSMKVLWIIDYCIVAWIIILVRKRCVMFWLKYRPIIDNHYDWIHWLSLLYQRDSKHGNHKLFLDMSLLHSASLCSY